MSQPDEWTVPTEPDPEPDREDYRELPEAELRKRAALLARWYEQNP